MTDQQNRAKLEQLREWAQEKAQSGGEPPWAWYQYMKLVETADAILKGMDATVTTESSQQSEAHPGGHLRLVDFTYRQDSVQSRSAETPMIPMPM